MNQQLLKIKIWLLIALYKRIHGYTKVTTKLLYAQAYHETGDFKSPVFKQNKNLFGMRQPKIRKTTATGSNLNHATYSSHRQSVIDYFYRQKEFRIPNTSDSEYIDKTVRSRYAEDPNYKSKWIAMKETIINPLGLFYALTAVSFFFLGVYNIFRT